MLGGLAAQDSGRLVRFMAKKEVFDHPVGGPVMRSMHHIAVDRGDGAGSLDEALRYLEDGEVVGIFPEATISRSFEVKELKTGAARIAAEAGVPLVPVALWGTQRLMTKDHPRDFSRGKTIGIRVGEPMHPTGDDPAAETLELHAAAADAGRRGGRRLPRRRAAPRLLVAARLPRRLGPDPRGGGRGSTPRRRRARAARKAAREADAGRADVSREPAACRFVGQSTGLCRHVVRCGDRSVPWGPGRPSKVSARICRQRARPPGWTDVIRGRRRATASYDASPGRHTTRSSAATSSS